MNKHFINKLKKENKNLYIDINNLKKHKKNLELVIENIKSSKVFKLWQHTQFLPKIINKIKMKYLNKFTHTSIQSNFSSSEPIKEKVSIIIPTRNGGKDFENNLDKLIHQEGIPNKEIIIMDNESTDGTFEYAKKMNCNVYKVQEKLFHHGKTRNEGVLKATGEYLILTVQDAYISDSKALCKLINFVKKYHLSAASCIQKPKPEADSFAIWQNHYHYSVLNPDHNSIVYLGEKIKGIFNDLSFMEKRKIVCIDDVLTCYKNEALKKYKFSETIDFAEDAEIAVKFIKDGKNIGITSKVIAFHSHNVDALYIFKRSFIDTVSLKDIFLEKPNRFFHKNDVKTEITTIFLLLSTLFSDKKPSSFNGMLRTANNFKKNKEKNDIIKLLEMIYPSTVLNLKNIDINLVRSIKKSIETNYYSYKKYCEKKELKPNFTKMATNILGVFLAEIIIYDNNKMYEIIKESIGKRV